MSDAAGDPAPGPGSVLVPSLSTVVDRKAMRLRSMAPPCAVHPTGKKDPDGCKDIPIPEFVIADAKGDTKGQKSRVLGWASNFANVYDAQQKYRNLKDAPKELYKDELWGIDVPFPL